MPSPRRTSRRATARPAPLSGLGSLTQTRGAGRVCTACGSGALTSIGMTLTDGTPVTFVSCHDCEHRSWVDGGEELTFAVVLDKTRVSA